MMKSTIAAIAILAMSAVYANAACNVTAPSIGSHLLGAHTETDCASAADVAAQGVTIGTLQTDVGVLHGTAIDHKDRIIVLETDSALHTSAITALQSGHAAQQLEIDALETENAEQQNGIQDNADKNVDQDADIETNTDNIAQNKERMDQFNGTSGTVEAWATSVDETNSAQNVAIANNAAAISSNAAGIEENSKGVAISMAMPDAFLDATENFSIAAGFGGFESDTAFGVIGSARLDKTWSLYGGGGMSTEGDTYGWKAGARAGW